MLKSNFFWVFSNKTSKFMFFTIFSGIISAIMLTSAVNGNFINNFENESSSKPNLEILEVQQQYNISIPKVDDSKVVIDGNITADEYTETFSDPVTQIDVFWEHNGVNLTVGLVSPGTGWVSLGIGAQMENSTMIMGGIDGNSMYCVDLVGISVWTHGEDEDNGGQNDILEFSSSENTTHTNLEFIIPLNSTDSLDPFMEEEGVYPMFFGFHQSSDSMTAPHSAHSAIFYVFLRSDFIIRQTTLFMTAPSTIKQGDEFYLSASLTDPQNIPYANKSLDFFIETIFGYLVIGTSSTNSSGQATIEYNHPTLSGNLTFGTRFQEVIVNETGQPKLVLYTGSEVSQSISIIPEEPVGEDPIRLLIGIVGFGIAAIALLGVWMIYGFNGLILLQFLFDRKPKAQKESGIIEEDIKRIDD